MGGGDGCRYVGVHVGLGWVMAARRSLGRLFTLILVGLLLTDYLVSCVLRFVYCVLRFSKIKLRILLRHQKFHRNDTLI